MGRGARMGPGGEGRGVRKRKEEEEAAAVFSAPFPQTRHTLIPRIPFKIARLPTRVVFDAVFPVFTPLAVGLGCLRHHVFVLMALRVWEKWNLERYKA